MVWNKYGDRHCCYVCGNPVATWFVNVAGKFWPLCQTHRSLFHG